MRLTEEYPSLLSAFYTVAAELRRGELFEQISTTLHKRRTAPVVLTSGIRWRFPRRWAKLSPCSRTPLIDLPAIGSSPITQMRKWKGTMRKRMGRWEGDGMAGKVITEGMGREENMHIVMWKTALSLLQNTYLFENRKKVKFMLIR